MLSSSESEDDLPMPQQARPSNARPRIEDLTDDDDDFAPAPSRLAAAPVKVPAPFPSVLCQLALVLRCAPHACNMTCACQPPLCRLEDCGNRLPRPLLTPPSPLCQLAKPLCSAGCPLLTLGVLVLHPPALGEPSVLPCGPPVSDGEPALTLIVLAWGVGLRSREVWGRSGVMFW